MIAAFCNSKCVTFSGIKHWLFLLRFWWLFPHFRMSPAFPSTSSPKVSVLQKNPVHTIMLHLQGMWHRIFFDQRFLSEGLHLLANLTKTIQNSCRFNSPSTYPKSNWRTTMLPRFQRPWPPPPVQCCADVHDALGQWRQRLKARGQTPKRSPVGTGMSWQIE